MLQRVTNSKQTRIPFVSLELGGQESRSVELALRPGDLNSSLKKNKSPTIIIGRWVIIHQVPNVFVMRLCVCLRWVCIGVSSRTRLSCLCWASKECRRSMRLDMPCSSVSRVWCWGSWPEKLSLKLRRASLTSCSSSPCLTQNPAGYTAAISACCLSKWASTRSSL